MTDELDALMFDDPLALSDADIDKIIAAQRKHRARLSGGAKPKKDTGPKAEIDLSALGLTPAAAVPTGFKRRA